MTTKVKTKHVPKCKKPADLTDKVKANTDLGKWWRQFCFNHISIIPGSFPKRRLFPKRPVEESGFTAMIRPPYQIYKVEIVDTNAKNDFKSRRVDHIVKKMQKSASAAHNGYKEHTNIFKHNANGAESLQRYREIYAYSRHRLAKINRKRLKKVAQMVKSSGRKEETPKKSVPRRISGQNREATKERNKVDSVAVIEHRDLKTNENVNSNPVQDRKTVEKIEKTPSAKQESTPMSSDTKCLKTRSGSPSATTTTSSPAPRSKSILDGLPPGTYTKRITFIKSPPGSQVAQPLKVTSIDFPDESTVSRKAAPLGRVINQTFTISTKITKASNEIQGSARMDDKKDETNDRAVVGVNPPSLPLLRRLKIPQQPSPQVFKYTDKINSLKTRLENEANDEMSSRVSSSKKPSLAKYAYRDDGAESKVDNATMPRLSEKNRQMFERLTRSPPAKDVIELTQRFLDKHKKK